MNDIADNIIVDTATRIFQDLCEPATVNDAEKGVWPKALWDALEEFWAHSRLDFGGSRWRRRHDGRRLRNIAGGGPLRRAGAACRDPDGRLALGAGRHRGAGRTPDDRPGSR